MTDWSVHWSLTSSDYWWLASHC